jgi:hypothetical protein
MNWKEQLDKAVATVRDAAESDRARQIADQAKATASSLLDRAKAGAIGAAQTFVEANRDPSALEVKFLHAQLTVVSPADGLTITRPQEGSLVIDDGQGNGLVVNAAADPAFIVDRIGQVTQISGNTFDLGAEDSVNLVVTKF